MRRCVSYSAGDTKKRLALGSLRFLTIKSSPPLKSPLHGVGRIVSSLCVNEISLVWPQKFAFSNFLT